MLFITYFIAKAAGNSGAARRADFDRLDPFAGTSDDAIQENSFTWKGHETACSSVRNHADIVADPTEMRDRKTG